MSDHEHLELADQTPSSDQAAPDHGGGAGEFGVGGVVTTPNTGEAVDFLMRYRGSDPIVLTAIVPNDGGTESDTFRPEQDGARLRKWIDARQGKLNIYFTVNPTLKPMAGRVKAKKTDIRGMTTLHVDLDPRAGEDLEEERVRAYKVLREFNPRPSFIIDSGGGFQAFWLLDEEHRTDGSEERAADLEAYNQQIALLLHADPCHNIDRIMRLPGTLNVPDAKKLKKGRRLALARIADWPEDQGRYSLTKFTAAPKVQARAGGGMAVKISGNLPRVDLDTLPERVPDKCKVVIVHGDDPDDPTRFPSRSEALFYVCCELKRAGVEDDVIASIIMDRDFAISASVLDKSRPEQYAARQVQRATEEAESSELRELNELHAVISDIGGKCRVVTEVPDPALGRKRLSKQTFEDFRNRYMHRLVTEGKKQTQLGVWWLRHPMRRQYDTLTFAPERHVEGAYNLWRGFAYNPVPGNCSLFLDHVRENICSGDEEHFDYLMNWMARAVQQPGSPGQVAVVMRGRRGTGKSVFATHFGRLWGRHFLQVSDPKHLVGSFNAHLRDCVVLFGDEAFYAGDKKHESILKTLITEPTFMIEGKGVDAEPSPNYTHLLLASNDQWVIPAGEDERRYLVLDVGAAQIQNSEYFAALQKQMDLGGYAALLHVLRTRDISEFEVRKFPRTAGLQEQQLLSVDPHLRIWADILADGVTPDDDIWKKGLGPDWISVEGMIEAMEAARIDVRGRSIATKLGFFLRPFLMRESDGKSVTTKLNRMCMFQNGRAIGPAEFAREGQMVRSVRRSMLRLRPLEELRAICPLPVEDWSGGPDQWIDNPQEDHDGTPDPDGISHPDDDVPF